MGNHKPLRETCMECQNGKATTPAVGTMPLASWQGNVVDMPAVNEKHVWNVTS